MASSIQANAGKLIIAKGLEQYRPRRTQRYAAINVLLLSWKDDDIGCADEIAELEHMFRDSFNYAVWPYRIPSQDPETNLNLTVAQFVSSFGREDGLIIVYYGGHGGPKVDTKSPCTWAAQIKGGPTLDWSVIQPQLTLLASCDVVILLDCCFAGQAARGHTARCVELLAATDKDQMTPTGLKKWPSFTKVLTAEMKATLERDGVATIPAIHSRMVEDRAGLQRQPFYVCLSGRDGSAGSIKLLKLGEVKSTEKSSSLGSVCLRLSLFDSLDLNASVGLVRWLTKDSPSAIEDIHVVDQVLSDAQDANTLCTDLLANNSEARAALLPILSVDGQMETQRLLGELKAALSQPSAALNQSAGSGIRNLLSDVKKATANLMTFVTDSLSSLNGTGAREMLEHCDIASMQELKSRIAMRLALVDDNPPINYVRVDFGDQAREGQRLRVGKLGGAPVLVEYVYYYDENSNSKKDDSEEDEITHGTGTSAQIWRQMNRISALHAESKTPAFRCFRGVGVLREILYGPRFGFVYSLPDHVVGAAGRAQQPKYDHLSNIIGQLKAAPLEARIRMAYALCNAVLHLHSIGWYHKNLKSSNVLVFANSEGTATGCWDFANPFLIGFDCSRPSTAETRNTVDFSTKDNIYRHPDRWGRSARFEKHHDLYALGIILLELGCWRTLPKMDAKCCGFEHVRDPSVLHDFLLKAAAEKLAHAAGTKYSEATLACLARRDPGVACEEGWQSQKLVREKVLERLDGALSLVA
ncbi:hypothetical protein QBC41DRAFT_331334 [Cercophora samala]|uniref:Protein kinase domain-containing protein n=1 Tax=Cercophora samala TaxID=330535 RepID=A0AA39YWB7_9PEZI|nr:hypothetical protein QBC41DRAFT_331334 [Cercophora samala]